MAYDANCLLGVLKHLKIGFFVLDAEGNYIFVNDTYCKLFNRTEEYFLSMSIPKFKELGHISNSVWEQVLQTKAPVIALITIIDKEYSVKRQHLTSGVPIFGENGEIRCIYYFIEPLEDLNSRLQAGMMNRRRRFMDPGALLQASANEDIVAESPKMKSLLSLLSIVSKTDASILFVGPTGSGKQVLAEYAHRMGIHSQGPFANIDCAAVPENLLESELFGYVKGAFTGALNEGKKGQIELADGGTLFLDEINSMPLALQSKLLRVLETKHVRRIGASDSKPINFRLICASNEDLEVMVKNGNFRRDLYYRINVVPIAVPSLKERREDITLLAVMFLKLFCHKYSCVKMLSEGVLHAMLNYDWPGNVRELRNFIERLVVTSPSTDIEITDMPNLYAQNDSYYTHDMGQAGPIAPNSPHFNQDDFSFHSYMEHCEKKLMQEAIAAFKTPAKIAEALKLDLSNVYRKLRKHNL